MLSRCTRWLILVLVLVRCSCAHARTCKSSWRRSRSGSRSLCSRRRKKSTPTSCWTSSIPSTCTSSKAALALGPLSVCSFCVRHWSPVGPFTQPFVRCFAAQAPRFPRLVCLHRRQLPQGPAHSGPRAQEDRHRGQQRPGVRIPSERALFSCSLGSFSAPRLMRLLVCSCSWTTASPLRAGSTTTRIARCDRLV